MDQSNISLLDQWRAAGNTGDLPVGWNGNGGSSGGGGTPNYPIPDIKLSDIGGSAMDFAKNYIDPMEDNAFNNYALFQRSQAKPLDIYNTLETQAGLPELRKTSTTLQGQVNDLEDAINRAEGNVNATTTNSMVTEAQRQGMVSARKYPLQQILTPLSTALGRVQSGIQNAEQGVNTKVGYALQGQQNDLDPYKTRMTMMADRASRLMTGFTADREANLNLLLEKIHAQQHLSDMEWQQASDLAKLKLQNDQEMAKITAQTDADIRKNNESYKALGKYGLYNPATGTYIAPNSSGSGGSGNTSNYYNNNSWEVVG